MATLSSVIADIATLSNSDKKTLRSYLISVFSVRLSSLEEYVKEERFSSGLVCPVCGCIHIVRNGHRKDGVQRYKCSDCGKSFVAMTNSIVTDLMNSYTRFAKKNGYQLVQLKGGKAKKGIYHIQHINSFFPNPLH